MENRILKIAYGSTKLPLRIGVHEIPCYILENEQRVFSIMGIQKSFGYDGKSELWLLNILKTIAKFSPLRVELLDAYEKYASIAIKNAQESTSQIGVIDSIFFIETCTTIVTAKNEGFLNVNYLKASKNASVLLSNLKDNDLDALIDAATGYSLFKEHVKSYLQEFLNTNLNSKSILWVKHFPNSFFEILFHIHDLNWKSVKEDPHPFGKIIYEVVFCRITNSLLEELQIKKPKRNYKRKDNKPQEVLPSELKEYLTSISSLLKASGYNWLIFLQLLNRAHPINGNFTQKFPTVPDPNFIKKIELSAFNKNLKIMS